MFWRKLARRAAALAALALAALVAYESYALWQAEARTPQILADYRSRSQLLPLASLSAERKDILLRVEDPAFYRHRGVDFSSPGQGMTTITQALVKFLYFKPFRPGFAKIEQSLIARFVLDRHLAKDEQLTLFLNHAYFGTREGREVRGFAKAAQIYFGKPFDDLSDDEYLRLVAMLIGPDALRPDRQPDALAERVARIRRFIVGQCRPDGVFDPYYKSCASSG